MCRLHLSTLQVVLEVALKIATNSGAGGSPPNSPARSSSEWGTVVPSAALQVAKLPSYPGFVSYHNTLVVSQGVPNGRQAGNLARQPNVAGTRQE